MKLYFEAEVTGQVGKIKEQFDRELFLKLKPPFLSLHLDRFDGCEVGNEVHLRMGLGALLQSWISVITEAHFDEKEWLFVDEGKYLPFPFKSWKHEHKVIQKTKTTCVISDSIEFDCKHLFPNAFIYGPLWLSFSNRPQIYRQVFGKPPA